MNIVRALEIGRHCRHTFFGIRILFEHVPQVTLGEHEQVGVADGTYVGCASIAGFVAFDVQNGQFAEHSAIGQRCKYRFA